MVNAAEILAGLARIANQAFAFAVLWHVLVAALLIALAFRWLAAPRLTGALLCAPLASVSGFAWAFGNPFNGTAFALLALALAGLSWRTPGTPGTSGAPGTGALPSRPWAIALGGLLVTFAWCYPHFLVGRSALAYVYGAPLGLIPCPTLSLLVGLRLLGHGPATRSWSFVLAGAGAFYALVGTLRLGVTVDLVLLAGSIGLLLQAIAHRRGGGRTPVAR